MPQRVPIPSVRASHSPTPLARPLPVSARTLPSPATRQAHYPTVAKTSARASPSVCSSPTFVHLPLTIPLALPCPSVPVRAHPCPSVPVHAQRLPIPLPIYIRIHCCRRPTAATPSSIRSPPSMPLLPLSIPWAVPRSRHYRLFPPIAPCPHQLFPPAVPAAVTTAVTPRELSGLLHTIRYVPNQSLVPSYHYHNVLRCAHSSSPLPLALLGLSGSAFFYLFLC